MRFNVLTDPWVPLEGRSDPASFVDVVTGVADGPGLSHPREDFRLFARMLLSAIGQALFPARTPGELVERMRSPLAADRVAEAVARVKDGFELVAPPGEGFMQPRQAVRETPEGKGKDDDNATAKLLLDVSETYSPWLLRHDRVYDALCAPCALLALYGFQSHAPAGGRGLSPGVRGAPPLTTLVWCSSVREMLWANTIVEPASNVRGETDPWRGRVKEKEGETIELVEGLFWQPRKVRYVVAQAGSCPTCGANGPRVSATAFEAGSKRSGGYFQHPLTPYFEEGKETQPQRLRVDRPAWTALADMLEITSRSAVTRGRSERVCFAAPVVQQWFEGLDHRSVSLEVFAFRFDNAKLLARFSETYTLSMQTRDRTILADLRGAVELAECALKALERSLRLACSSRRKSKQSFWPQEARANFWQRTEPAFWAHKQALEAGGDPGDALARSIEKIATRIYVQATETAALDERHQKTVAIQHKRLRDELRKLLGTGQREGTR